MDNSKEGIKMRIFRIKYYDGKIGIVKAETTLKVIKKYDLATKEHINTKITELTRKTK